MRQDGRSRRLNLKFEDLPPPPISQILAGICKPIGLGRVRQTCARDLSRRADEQIVIRSSATRRVYHPPIGSVRAAAVRQPAAQGAICAVDAARLCGMRGQGMAPLGRRSIQAHISGTAITRERAGWQGRSAAADKGRTGFTRQAVGRRGRAAWAKA
jgi:hypothetical protein